MWLLAVLTLLPVLDVALAQPMPVQATFSAVRDNSLFQESPDFSNGSGEHLFAGSIITGQFRRALVAFDLSSIPPGSTVQSVSLQLFMSRTISGGNQVALHRLTADWGEAGSDAPGQEGAGTMAQAGDATWQHRFYDTTPWAMPGGDFVASSSASALVADLGFYSWSSSGMVADVQGWVDQPGSNFGWIIRGNEAASGTAKRFDSRENAVPANRPVLTVEYVPAATGGVENDPEAIPVLAPFGGLLLVFGMLALARRRL